MIGAFDGRLDVGELDPWDQTQRNEHIINARAIVSLACTDLRIPAWGELYRPMISATTTTARQICVARTGKHSFAVWPEPPKHID